MDYIENNILSKERIIAEYTPHTVDGIKFAKGYNTAAVNSSKIQFFKTWMNIMKNNKSAYLKAWLMETKGYYHIGPTTMPCVFYIADNEFGIQNEKLVDQVFGKPIQGIMDWFQSRFARMCSIGAIMTLIWFCVCCIIVNQKYSYLVVCSPVLGIWISLMIGTPIYGDFRYIYPAFLAVPLILILTEESFRKIVTFD